MRVRYYVVACTNSVYVCTSKEYDYTKRVASFPYWNETNPNLPQREDALACAHQFCDVMNNPPIPVPLQPATPTRVDEPRVTDGEGV